MQNFKKQYNSTTTTRWFILTTVGKKINRGGISLYELQIKKKKNQTPVPGFYSPWRDHEYFIVFSSITPTIIIIIHIANRDLWL